MSCPIPEIKAKDLNKTESHSVNYSALVLAIRGVLVLPLFSVRVDKEAIL